MGFDKIRTGLGNKINDLDRHGGLYVFRIDKTLEKGIHKVRLRSNPNED
jgi:hypothetical protein